MRLQRHALVQADECLCQLPDQVIDHFLAKSGVNPHLLDIRIKRLMGLAAQKFISEVANDAYQYNRIRSTGGAGGGGNNPNLGAGPGIGGQPAAPAALGGPGVPGIGMGGGGGKGKAVLTMEDLNAALSEYGINSKRPDFYR